MKHVTPIALSLDVSRQLILIVYRTKLTSHSPSSQDKTTLMEAPHSLPLVAVIPEISTTHLKTASHKNYEHDY